MKVFLGENANWFTEDLINKSFNILENKKILKKETFNTNNFFHSFVREIDGSTKERFCNNSNFENTLLNILTNIEIDLKKLSKKN